MFSITVSDILVPQKLRFDKDFLQATVCAFLQPQQKSWGRQLSSDVPSSVATFRSTIEQPTKAHTAFQVARVSWPNMGPAAAGPAGPAPTALIMPKTMSPPHSLCTSMLNSLYKGQMEASSTLCCQHLLLLRGKQQRSCSDN